MSGRPRETGTPMWMYRVLIALGPLPKLYWRPRLVVGNQAIPSAGPLIVVCNHSSFLDPFFLVWTFPRPIRFLINRDWYERSPLWHGFFRNCGTIPVSPQDPSATLDSVTAALESGDVVGVFPEGRISRDGSVGRFRSGVAYAAASTGVPVLSLGIRGAFESLPRTRRLPRREQVTVHVGVPVVFPGSPCGPRPPARDVVRFARFLRSEVCGLVGQGGPPSSPDRRP